MAANGRQFSIDVKQEILHFRSLGQSHSQICDSVKLQLDVQISRQGVRRFLNRYDASGSVHRRPPSSRQTKVTDVHRMFIDMWMEGNPEITAHCLQDRIMSTFNIQLSISHIRYLRRSLGWQSRQVEYCQMISHKNKAVRLDWCLEALLKKETFDNVIFTDETSIEMTSAGRLFFYHEQSSLQNMPRKAPKPKHAYKVHMWGGISYHGRTDCCLFTGIMDSVIYQKILGANLLPFTEKKFPDGFRLYQDNDSKHKSVSTMKWMQETGLKQKLMVTPASSPDLNPIENVWSALKDYLSRHVKPKRKEELVAGIRTFWNSLSAAQCGKYIDHVHRVIPQVVLNNGGPTVF